MEGGSWHARLFTSGVKVRRRARQGEGPGPNARLKSEAPQRARGAAAASIASSFMLHPLGFKSAFIVTEGWAPCNGRFEAAWPRRGPGTFEVRAGPQHP